MVVAGAGLGFVTDADQMHFTYQSVRGDVDIVARLREIVEPHPLATGGIMIRASLDADASYAALTTASLVGESFSRRLARGWTRLETAASRSASWFKLERRGALVSGFVSEDGVHWEFLGSELVNLDDEVHVGLLAASHQAGTLTTAVFDHVEIRGVDGPGIPGSSPEPSPAPVPDPTPVPESQPVPVPTPPVPRPEPVPTPGASTTRAGAQSRAGRRTSARACSATNTGAPAYSGTEPCTHSGADAGCLEIPGVRTLSRSRDYDQLRLRGGTGGCGAGGRAAARYRHASCSEWRVPCRRQRVVALLPAASTLPR